MYKADDITSPCHFILFLDALDRMELKQNNDLSLLDVLLMKQDENLQHTIYRKPTYISIYLTPESLTRQPKLKMWWTLIPISLWLTDASSNTGTKNDYNNRDIKEGIHQQENSQQETNDDDNKILP